VNTGGVIEGDAAYVGIHAVAAGGKGVPGITLRSCGISVPDKIVTNDDLSARLDTNDQWIAERTGIRERRVGDHLEPGHRGWPGGDRAGRARTIRHRPGGVGDHHPDALVPATAATVQDGLGVPAGLSTSTPPARGSSMAW